MRKYILILLALVFPLLSSGCFKGKDYSVDYQKPNVFRYEITGTTEGYGKYDVQFVSSKNSSETHIYEVSDMLFRFYDYSSSPEINGWKSFAPLFEVKPRFSNGNIYCETSASEEELLKRCKQVLAVVQVTRGGNSIALLQGIVSNGYNRAGSKFIKLDYNTYAQSLLYNAWHIANPSLDFDDFVYNCSVKQPYLDLAVEGIKKAVSEWNNWPYLNFDFDNAYLTGIAASVGNIKCFDLYCQKLPQLVDGIFSGCSTEDIVVSVYGVGGVLTAKSKLGADGAFSFSLPGQKAYELVVSSGNIDKSLYALGLFVLDGNGKPVVDSSGVPVKNLLTKDTCLYDKDFIVK